jgi:hypothetical protein
MRRSSGIGRRVIWERNYRGKDLSIEADLRLETDQVSKFVSLGAPLLNEKGLLPYGLKIRYRNAINEKHIEIFSTITR